MKPGWGNFMTNPVEDFSSKKDFALGFFSTYWVRLPLNCLSLRFSMAMILLHTRSSKPVSWDTITQVTSLSPRRYSSTHFTFITSRWLVGSSIRRMSALRHMARASASFMRQPPER
mmetsp:Transcript_3620/g.15899  ORF Transcript_3620/g.15899 Transcript_3620/m.15899 type:complete len:116 (+) Transcript_3620:314-661(+)